MKFLLFFVFHFGIISCHAQLDSANFGKSLQLGGYRLKVEIADTQEARARGLMFREHLDEGMGMLFIFEKPDILSFWMKNTLIPLSIAFFDENQTLLNIEDMHPVQKERNLPSFKSKAPAKYALEVPQGWFKKNKITPGMKFSFLDQCKSVE